MFSAGFPELLEHWGATATSGHFGAGRRSETARNLLM